MSIIQVQYDNLFLIPIVGGILCIYLISKFTQRKEFISDVRLDGKVIIITGCNTGIGKETALDLARRGAIIYMACRNYRKCEEARLEIISKTGNQKIYNRKLDLASFTSIRAFVKKFHQDESRLDILINNAGICTVKCLYNENGYEMTLAVNHLGPFLLTNLLLDTLKLSAPSRIVMVSSLAHIVYPINKMNFNCEQSYFGHVCYCRTKLANILFARELTKQLKNTGVTINSLHPGLVRTDILNVQPFYLRFTAFLLRFLFLSPKSGAQTTLMVALDKSLENVSGQYFSNCQVAKESPLAKNDKMAKWLWDKSIEMTGLQN